MAKRYDPFDWYWVGALGAFSSARIALVPDDDPAFLAWKADGSVPTPMPRDEAGQESLDALQDVLTPYGLSATLADLKDKLKVQVDARAEALRLSLITPGSGQAMEYQEAYAEAVAAQAAQAALSTGQALDPAKYPMLAASVGLDTDPQTGEPTTDIVGEAGAVLAAYDAYQRAGAAIRGARLRAKAAIEAAVDVTAVRAAAAAIAWPPLG